jgi:hypothetical protein
MRLLTEIEEMAFAQERVQAWKSIAAELRRERDHRAKEVEGLARMKKYLAEVVRDAKRYARSSTTMQARCLGVIEGILVVLNALEAGKPIPYKFVPCTEWSWRSFGMIPSARRETYRECLYRLAEEVLCKKTQD